jgi:hypothetical protein
MVNTYLNQTESFLKNADYFIRQDLKMHEGTQTSKGIHQNKLKVCSANLIFGLVLYLKSSNL